MDDVDRHAVNVTQWGTKLAWSFHWSLMRIDPETTNGREKKERLTDKCIIVAGTMCIEMQYVVVHIHCTENTSTLYCRSPPLGDLCNLHGFFSSFGRISIPSRTQLLIDVNWSTFLVDACQSIDAHGTGSRRKESVKWLSKVDAVDQNLDSRQKDVVNSCVTTTAVYMSYSMAKEPHLNHCQKKTNKHT